MKKSLVLVLALLCVVIGLNLLFYFIYFPGSTLDGQDVSWEKRPQDITEEVDKQLFFVSEKGNIHEEITPKGFLSSVFRLPKKSLFTLKPLHQTWSKDISYAPDELEKHLHAAYERLPKNQDAQNASLSLKDGEVLLQAGQPSISLPDENTLLSLAKEALAKGEFTVSLEEYFHEPETPSRDLRAEANLWKKAHLLCPDYEWNLEGKEYLSLFNPDFSLNQEKAQKRFKEYFDGADEGNTVWKVDQEASLPLFVKALQERATQWKPEYTRVTKDPDSAYAMGDGIVISIDRQWLWLYRGGSVVFQTPIVSGNSNRGYPTHRGYWSIVDMDTNTRLANTNREGESYNVAVSYWMQFNYEGMIEGIHDASWQWGFGTDAYLYHGSHGCINVMPSDMGTIYSQSWIGMPVVVY